MIKFIKKQIHRIKDKKLIKETYDIKNNSEYIYIKRINEDKFNINNNIIVIPLQNINYIFSTDIYDEEYNKYKIRKTIVLKTGEKHKIYDKDEVKLCNKIDVERFLKN